MLVTFIIGSCAPAPTSPTHVPTAIVTKTLAPSATPSQTNTETLTLPPQTQEHLLVTRDGTHLTMLNADGSLYKFIQVPNDQYFLRPDKDVSPDGKWLAYESGSIDEPYNYSLTLLNLHDQKSLLITKLISPDFPKNMEPIIETISQYDEALYGSDCYKDSKCLRSLVQEDVLLAAGSSPGRRMAVFSHLANRLMDRPQTFISTDCKIRQSEDLRMICRTTLGWSGRQTVDGFFM